MMTAMAQMIPRIWKLDDLKRKLNVDAFLISSASSVKYFSGYFFYFEYGNSPFHLLPSLLMVVPGYDNCLIIADNELGQSSFFDPALTLVGYESYRYEKPPDPAGECVKMISAFIEKNKLGSSRIGMEPAAVPFVITESLRTKFPSLQWVDCSKEIDRLKMVKDPDEIENIRRAAALSDIGQEAIMKYAKEGMSELELFALAHQDMEKNTGTRVALMADLSSGINTNSGGGMPTKRIIREGDLILSDFQACLHGYWGDS
jgi:Xaa-Pro aminopeptidase